MGDAGETPAAGLLTASRAATEVRVVSARWEARMFGCKLRFGSVLLGLLLLPLAGCPIVTDLFNPQLTGAGPFPQSGTIIVAFNNDTNAAALFQAVEVENPADPEQGARNFSVLAEPGESRNEVLYCPVGLVTLGSLDESFSYETLAVTIYDGEDEIELDYLGSPLLSGREYQCGDVIEATLSVTGAGYGLAVRVIPGR